MDTWQLILIAFVAGIFVGVVFFEYGYDTRLVGIGKEKTLLEAANAKIIQAYHECTKDLIKERETRECPNALKERTY